MTDSLPRILIIDDNPDIARLLHPLLCDIAQMSMATSGSKGIELAVKLVPDLILLDMQLPDMDGLAVCRQLKSEPLLADIPVLFVTAGDTEDAEVAALECGAVDFLGKPLRPQVVRARVSTHLALNRQTKILRQIADVDGLTGIYNRRYFDTVLAEEVARQRRFGGELSVAMIDVDHFKAYNDLLGHQQGDQCLRQVAQALAASMRRPGEVLARYGGEEFVMVAPGVGKRDAATVAEWLRMTVAGLALPHLSSSTGPHVTISVGIASCAPGAPCVGAHLLELADGALYAAKQAGRNRSFAVDC